jgi:hypothetical protein
MDQSVYLNKCLTLVEAKFDWGNRSDWTNREYRKLSEQIEEVSGILLSTSTLKRVFGKIKLDTDRYQPQEETRNALAIFIGCRNWDDFVRRQQAVAGSPPEPLLVPAPPPVPETLPATTRETPPPAPVLPARAGRKLWQRAAVPVLAALVLVGLLSWLNRGRHAGIPFAGKYLKGTPPLTPIFSYDLSGVESDSVYLDVGVADTVIRLQKAAGSVTAWYQIPGHFKVQVVANGKPASEKLPVHVLSDGWVAGVSKEREFNPWDFRKLPYEGRLYFDRAQAHAMHADTSRLYWSEWRNVRDFGVDGDNFTFETRVKNSAAEGGLKCQDVLLRLFGEREDLRVQFVQPGCFRWVAVRFAEIEKSGDTEDLSAFGQEIGQWADVKIQVKNRQAAVFFNGKRIYEAAYRQPVGMIKGISYKFFGTGSADYVRLYDGSGKVVYGEDF